MKRAVLLFVAVIAVGMGWRFRERLGLVHAPSTELCLTGFLEGEERILRSEVAGVVTQVLVREGDVVSTGTPLVRIDIREARSRRAQQALSIAELEARIEQSRRSLDLTRVRVEHAIKMAASETAHASADLVLAKQTLQRAKQTTAAHAAPVAQLDEAEDREHVAESALARAKEAESLAQDGDREVRVAESELAVLEARVAVEQERLGELDLILSKHEICADGPGTVQARLIRAGELAQPGRALLSLLDEDDKYVRVFIPVLMLPSFHVTTRVTVELDQLPGRTFPGRVEWIDSQATFTPRNIYTPDDRTQQVYESRVRLERGMARDIRVGAEASVHLAENEPPSPVATAPAATAPEATAPENRKQP
jgi:HlyD family secretion protein